MVEIEAKGADDGHGQALERLAARQLDVTVEAAAAQGSADDARARIGHVHPGRRRRRGGPPSRQACRRAACRTSGTTSRVRPPGGARPCTVPAGLGPSRLVQGEVEGDERPPRRQARGLSSRASGPTGGRCRIGSRADHGTDHDKPEQGAGAPAPDEKALLSSRLGRSPSNPGGRRDKFDQQSRVMAPTFPKTLDNTLG